MGTAQNIRQIRRVYHITQRELADIAGVTENAVSKWENNYSEPRMGAVERIAACFGLTKYHIIEDGGMDLVDPKTKEVRYPTDVPASVPDSDPSLTLRKHMAASTQTTNALVGIPLVDNPLAWKEESADSSSIDYDNVFVPSFLLRGNPDCFAFSCKNDSMSKRFPKGCILVVSSGATIDNNSLALVGVEGVGTVVRRFYRTAQTLVLSPESYSSEYDDIIVRASDLDRVSCIGKVIWFQPQEPLG